MIQNKTMYHQGPDGKTHYLALQGPLPRTVDDFWRVIASHKCQVIHFFNLAVS